MLDTLLLIAGFLFGYLIGLIVMDLLWAHRLGLTSLVRVIIRGRRVRHYD